MEHRGLKALRSSPLASPLALAAARASATATSAALRAAVRKDAQEVACRRDVLLHSVLSSNPNKLYKTVNRNQRSRTPTLHELQVGKCTYTGEAVPDRFYDALTSLKIPNPSTFTSNPSFLTAKENYRNILEFCSVGPPIPSISSEEAQKLLEQLRPDVTDVFSISAHHYLTAGTNEIKHFTHILNLLISDLNTTSVPEVNSAWSIMLHKGHGKPRSSSRSWRCISTRPLLAKALDLKVANL